MPESRAGSPPQPSDLVDVAHLVTAYYTGGPDPDEIDQRVAFGTSGHRGSSLETAFNEAHILATTQAICDYRREQGNDGPLFLGRDTHGLSEPAWATAIEVLVANDVTVLVDDRDGYTPTPAVSHAILRANRGKAQLGRPGSPTASSSRRRTTRPATAGSSTTRPTAGRPTPTPPGGSPSAANALHRGRPGRRAAGAVHPRPRPPRRRTTSSAPTSTTCPRCVDLDAIRDAGVRIGADPLGGAAVRVLGRDRRAARPRPHRGQPPGRPHVAVHDAGLGRQDPDGLLLAVGDGLAHRHARTTTRSPPATTPTPTGTASSRPTAG